eukprot:9837663-Lingulodinium_polyedra.AAC.1
MESVGGQPLYVRSWPVGSARARSSPRSLTRAVAATVRSAAYPLEVGRTICAGLLRIVAADEYNE